MEHDIITGDHTAFKLTKNCSKKIVGMPLQIYTFSYCEGKTIKSVAKQHTFNSKFFYGFIFTFSMSISMYGIIISC